MVLLYFIILFFAVEAVRRERSFSFKVVKAILGSVVGEEQEKKMNSLLEFEPGNLLKGLGPKAFGRLYSVLKLPLLLFEKCRSTYLSYTC